MPSQHESIRLGTGHSFRLLRWNRSVNSVEVILSPSTAIAVEGQGDHWHYHAATELTFIRKGSGTRFVADQIGFFESGDLMLIGSNVPHYWHMRGVSSGLSIQWDFPLEHGFWSFAEAAPLRTLLELASRGLQIRGKTADDVRQRMEELTRYSGLERLSVFFQILSGLVSAPFGDIRPVSDRPFSLSGSAKVQESIRRAVSYILANYREPLNLPELLKLTGMSRATFARQFHLHAGKSFSTFRNQVRLQAVLQALRETDGAVGDIALSHGFNQLSFFNRLFRREFGISPSAYRQQKRD